MNLDSPFLYEECHGFYGKRNRLILAIVAVVTLFLCANHALNYRQLLDNARQFQDYEKLNFSMLGNYTQYSIMGVRIRLLPGPTSIFFANSGVFKELSARINPSTAIDIYADYKGDIPGASGGFFPLDAAGFLRQVLAVLCLLLGFELFYRPEYLKLLLNAQRGIKIFAALLFSRFFFILLSFLFICGLALAAVMVMGIRFSPADYAVLAAYLGSASLNLAFFYLLGALTAVIFKKWVATAALPVLWISLVLLLPLLFNSLSGQTGKKEQEKIRLDSKKLNIASSFEKECKRKAGNFDRKRLDIFRVFAESFWDNERIILTELEVNYKNAYDRYIRDNSFFPAFFPTTFHQSACGEAGSTGYRNYFEFYDYVIRKQAEFTRFYIDRCFYHNPLDMVSFIRGDDNLYRARSRVPYHYWPGMFASLAWCLGIFLLLWFRFKRFGRGKANANHRAAPGKPKDITDIRVNPGESNVLLYKNEHFPARVYAYFSSRSNAGAAPFYYICHPRYLPGHLRVEVFIRFMAGLLGLSRDQREQLLHSLPAGIAQKPLRRLDHKEKGGILLALMGELKDRKGVFLVNNIQDGLPVEFAFRLKEFMEDMERAGSAVIYLTDKPVVSDARFLSGQEYEEITGWKKTVELIQKALEKQEQAFNSAWAI